MGFCAASQDGEGWQGADDKVGVAGGSGADWGQGGECSRVLT